MTEFQVAVLIVTGVLCIGVILVAARAARHRRRDDVPDAQSQQRQADRRPRSALRSSDVPTQATPPPVGDRQLTETPPTALPRDVPSAPLALSETEVQSLSHDIFLFNGRIYRAVTSTARVSSEHSAPRWTHNVNYARYTRALGEVIDGLIPFDRGSRERLADRADLSLSTLDSLSESSNPQLQTLWKLAQAKSLDLSHIFAAVESTLLESSPEGDS